MQHFDTHELSLFLLACVLLQLLFVLFFSFFSLSRSLFFTQVDVHDPAAQQQGHTHPGQDEAVAKASWGQFSGVL